MFTKIKALAKNAGATVAALYTGGVARLKALKEKLAALLARYGRPILLAAATAIIAALLVTAYFQRAAIGHGAAYLGSEAGRIWRRFAAHTKPHLTVVIHQAAVEMTGADHRQPAGL
jgi:hypothetical protein